MTTKTDIRRHIHDQRQELTPNWVRPRSDRIQQRLLALDEWSTARLICCYLAAPTEVQTGWIIDDCRQAGKQVWVPAFRPTRERYEWTRLARADALTTGRHHIPEPEQPDWNRPGVVDIVITPGLAFDSHGGRIGHGGGHYDRLLARAALRTALKVGLAFVFQIRDHVPTLAHDIGMDIIVTEYAVIRCR